MNFIYQLCALALMFLNGTYAQGEKMNEIYEFTKAHAYAENSSSHSLSFTSDSGKKILIQLQESEIPFVEFVRRAVAENKEMFVAYDSATGLCRFAAPFTKDYVQSVETKPDLPQVLKVTLLLRPSYLFLSTNHPRFNELLKLLEAAKGKEQLVWVGTFPGDSKILDIRLP